MLSLCGEEVEETEIAGLASDQQTFHCSNVAGKKVVQVRLCIFLIVIKRAVCMSNKTQRVGSRGPYSTRQSRVLYGTSRPHTECFITHTAYAVHAISNLLSVKHCMTNVQL